MVEVVAAAAVSLVLAAGALVSVVAGAAAVVASAGGVVAGWFVSWASAAKLQASSPTRVTV